MAEQGSAVIIGGTSGLGKQLAGVLAVGAAIDHGVKQHGGGERLG